jgi:mandelamide amidase
VVAFDLDNYRRQAEASDGRRKNNISARLDGVPLILKDNIDTQDFPTTGGTGALTGKIPSKDAPVVVALKKEGAIIAGKAVMHELAFGITSNNPVTGPVRNPYDPSKIPGGSSGGTATAVSSRQFPAGLGTDTGGSVRIPSALCGIFGFRPTVGRYPGEGVIPISKTRDTVGPMARNIKDIAFLDALMAGKSAPDVTLLDLKSIKIGMPRTRFWENLETEVEGLGRDLLKSLEEEGVTIVDADFPDIWELNDNTGFPVALFEVMRELPLYLERAGYGISLEELIDGIGSPDVKGLITSQQGDEAMPEAAYTAAMEQHRPKMQKMYADYFAEHGLDAIIFPTTPLTTRPIGQDETVELNGNQEPTFPIFIRNTDLGSNIGAPGISLPVGLGNGLPVGMAIDGLPGEDERLLSLSATIEKILEPLPAP